MARATIPRRDLPLSILHARTLETSTGNADRISTVSCRHKTSARWFQRSPNGRRQRHGHSVSLQIALLQTAFQPRTETESVTAGAGKAGPVNFAIVLPIQNVIATDLAEKQSKPPHRNPLRELPVPGSLELLPHRQIAVFGSNERPMGDGVALAISRRSRGSRGETVARVSPFTLRQRRGGSCRRTSPSLFALHEAKPGQSPTSTRTHPDCRITRKPSLIAACADRHHGRCRPRNRLGPRWTEPAWPQALRRSLRPPGPGRAAGSR